MPLDTEVGLGPGDIVLDGDPAPSTERGTAAPYFSAHVPIAAYVCCDQTVACVSNAELLFTVRVSAFSFAPVLYYLIFFLPTYSLAIHHLWH